MEDKLDQLETEREWLIDMCPKDKLASYDEGKESTMVRMIIRYLPKEYDMSVKKMRFGSLSQSRASKNNGFDYES
jgi:hypothetical protein